MVEEYGWRERYPLFMGRVYDLGQGSNSGRLVATLKLTKLEGAL